MTTPAEQGWQLAGTSADAYERFLVPAIFGPWAGSLVDLARPRPGERVLDAACGTGVVARRAARFVAPGGAVTGVDVNAPMLATARRAGADVRVDWRQVDAVALPFPAGSFDVVFCQQGLQFVSDRGAAARQMRGALAPTGRLALSVWRGLEYNHGFALFADALERHAAAAGDIMRAPFAFGDREALRGLLLGAGFDRLRIVIETRLCRFPSPADLLRYEALASPLGGPLGQLDPIAWDALVVDVERALAPYVDDEGLAVPMEAHLALATSGPPG